MASPFPGMDLYLEGDLWQEFHETLAGAIRAQLMPQLSPKYVALLAKRYVLDRPALGVFDVPPRTIYPDVHVVAPHDAAMGVAAVSERTGNTATTGTTAPSTEVPNYVEAPQLSVEIRDVAQRRLITVIEILSPANKYGEGGREYLDRRMELLQTEVHLLELDLLRQGGRVPFVDAVPAGDYYVYLSRRQRRPLTQVWALSLRDRLPTVPVPLLPPDPDVVLDVQEAVAGCFTLVGYERLIDYTTTPPPPELSQEDSRWVEATLRAAGYRLDPGANAGMLADE